MTLKHVILMGALLTATLCADADVTVSKCSSDVLPTSGTDKNLTQALASGGLITLNCPPGTVMEMRLSHQVLPGTIIDGGNNVTLDVSHLSNVFYGAGPGLVILKNLRIQNGLPPHGTVEALSLGIHGLIHGTFALKLDHVSIEHSYDLVSVDSLEVSNGRYSGNTGYLFYAKNIVVKNAYIDENRQAVPLGVPVAYRLAGGAFIAAIEDTVVSGNAGIIWPGDLTIRRSTFDNNGDDAQPGGALKLTGNAYVEKSKFTKNHASFGGAISTGNSSQLTIRRCRFIGNKATGQGGAIHVGSSRSTTVTVSYSHFVSNSAKNGGALSLAATPGVKITLLAKLNEFNGNQAVESGGGIYSNGLNLAMASGFFVDNVAGVAGGAIAVGGNDTEDARLGNVVIARNKAPTGGGYYGNHVEFIHSTFADNAGGAIRLRKGRSGAALTVNGHVRLIDTVLVRNGMGCPPAVEAQSVDFAGVNIQFPERDCGSTVLNQDPKLDTMYVPAVDSVARSQGEPKFCLQDPLVHGEDAFGEARLPGQKCTLGAVERDLVRHALVQLRPSRDMDWGKAAEYLQVLNILRYLKH
jgi:predicted outer membrane repeat protein